MVILVHLFLTIREHSSSEAGRGARMPCSGLVTNLADLQASEL